VTTRPTRAAEMSLPILEKTYAGGASFDTTVADEWLVTNGLGGYASGSVAQCNTRRFHGVFVPSLDAPHGRTMLLPRLGEDIQVAGTWHRLDTEERLDGTRSDEGVSALKAFRVSGLIPQWDYGFGSTALRKKIVFVHGENTVYVIWENLQGPDVPIRLRPWPSFRYHDRPITALSDDVTVHLRGARVELEPLSGLPSLKLRLHATCPAPFVGSPEISAPQLYRIERARGLDHTEILRSPGYFQCQIEAGATLALAITVGAWEKLDASPTEVEALELERQRRLLAQAPEAARTGTAARLVLAADQFIIDPSARPADEVWARATGQDARSVIAGYHWFTDWGRDTMISLEGLTLSTARCREAGAILRTFQHYVRDGLLPNLFPEGGREGLYHTADATLWFFHSIHRVLSHERGTTVDPNLLRDLFPTLQSIVEHHLRGTHYGIGVDPADGLLRQGAEGYQLTWMDAKVDGWVVTPRRGKAVELSALWFNALRLMADWAKSLGEDPTEYLRHAERAQVSFNQRFWNPATQALFDVVDGEVGDDAAIRPNQIFALSLQYPVLAPSRWKAVLTKVREELLTPVGLRSLAPDHPDYKATYDGDLRSRDAAYHQGTVWGWLIGHFIDATLKVNPDRAAARALLKGFESHLGEGGLGQISEIFDASPPFRPRGCIAQAWSVAETLRAWLLTEP
jgi:predicted glycogen debranching enzyme